ncbi:MAG TPA: hypothetical protein VE449_06420 [Thermoleophilaceae bacterium]|nr:hypothetical protein [Thermoleophilaceae bacterium]
MFAGLLALSGCGEDDEEAARTTSTAPPATVPVETVPTEATETVPIETGTETETESEPVGTPEEQEGGQGDEEPARTLALFTARSGRITPRAIRVPAFISIQVELRSADGKIYGLRFGGTTITAGGELNSVSTTIDGLRPGEAVFGRPTGAGNRVRVEATAEPGP